MVEGNRDWITVCAVLEGDVDSFALLIERYKEYVAIIVRSHVPVASVAEVSHEVFVRAYKSLAGYKPTHPFKHWLSTIAVRSCTDFWRMHYRNRETVASEFSEDAQQWLETACFADSEEAYEALSRQQEARNVLEQVLHRLSPLDRMVLTMTQLDEYSLKETANLLGISVANVKIRSFRAKRTVRKYLKELGIEGA